MDETGNCVISNKRLNGEGDVVTLKEKGSEGINRPVQSGLIPLLRSLGSRYIRPAGESTVVPAASSELRNLFQKKQPVGVAPLLAKQNKVSPSRPIVSFVAPKLNLGRIQREKDWVKHPVLQQLKPRTRY